MIDYAAAVRDMMADCNLAVCFWTKEQCRELRRAIIDEIGNSHEKCCGHAYNGIDYGQMAFRLCHTIDGSGRWMINGGNHNTYDGTNHEGWYRRFIEEYEVPDEEYESPISFQEPISLDILFGEVTA